MSHVRHAIAAGIVGTGLTAQLPRLAVLPPEPRKLHDTDWLIDARPFHAGVFQSADGKELVLRNGLVRRAFRLEPNAATVALDILETGQAMLRGVKPEAVVVIDDKRYEIGGLRGQTDYAFLRPSVVDQLTKNPSAFGFSGFVIGAPVAPFGWKRVRHHDESRAWPPHGVAVRLDFTPPPSATELRGIRVAVHYELYDGLPCIAKWIEVHNGSQRRITIDRFTSEILAVVEPESRGETHSLVPFRLPNVWVETDYAAGGSNRNAMRWSVHWVPDPDYRTQVNYKKQQPCLLECRPGVGPDQDIAPGKSLRSFRSYVLLHDSEDRMRNGLARRKMYRTIAPWVTENPLMMHVRYADDKTVRAAIDQCAAVGFELVILTFGSGFNIEDDSSANLAKMKSYADYARAKGIEIGGYSLLSSRRIGGGNDIVSPPGEKPTHGSCPALTSAWGQTYFRKLRAFFEKTGFDMLEHDGPYPGDFDVTARPPLQKGYADSQWAQFWISSGFYRWCRERGIYLNTPDWYFLAGSTKCAMGYREVNWSLPRADQVLHTRQNIYDGTYTKTPSMGWMFVPLTQYHGGGAAATVEPLHEHLDHYERMLSSNLAAGVQACYRGPRLFDTPETKAAVTKWVHWFKLHRDILESDIIQSSSRRADGRDLDWLLHANPRLDQTGMVVIWNPLDRPIERTLAINVYYTGLRHAALLRQADGPTKRIRVDQQNRVRIPVVVPAQGFTWCTLSPTKN